MKTVRDVLEYLLEHDEDMTWMAGENNHDPFLCNRTGMLMDAGMIDEDLYREAMSFINEQLVISSEYKCETLAEYHQMTMKTTYVPVRSFEWAKIRQSYLRKWIEELESIS